MIKCKIKRGGKVKIAAKGKGANLGPETLLLIQQVYRGIKAKNPEAADAYKRGIIGTLIAPDSPVWKEV